MSPSGARGWATAWSEVVAAAVLGTDRRPLPAPPEGLLPDALVLDAHGRADDDAARLLDRAAALTAVRRAARLLDPAPALLPPCPIDLRPPCPPAAARRLAEVREAWPMLVDEWLGALLDAGCRLPPEHAVGLLERSRADPGRRALVERAAGPLAPWLGERFPQRLAPRRPSKGPAAPATVGRDGAASVELPGELAELLGRTPEELTDVIVDGLASGRFVGRHRPALVAFACRLDRAALATLAAGLEQLADPRAAVLAGDLAALVRTRLALHDDFLDAGAGGGRVGAAAREGDGSP